MFAGARANEYARSVMSASYIVAILRHIAANNNPPWWDSYGRMLKTADGGPGGAPGKQCIVAVYENSVWVEVRDFNSHRKTGHGLTWPGITSQTFPGHGLKKLQMRWMNLTTSS